MSEDIIEKKIFSDIRGGKKESLEPNGAAEEEEGLPPSEQPPDEKILAKESEKIYEKEIKEITKLAEKAGFKAISIVEPGKDGTRFKSPDTYFISRNTLANLCEALKFIEKEDLYQGMSVEFLEMRKRFKGKKFKIYRKFDDEHNKLEKLRKEPETDEKKLIKRGIDLDIIQEKINRMDEELDADPRNKISKLEIKEQALRFVIMNILSVGIENSDAVNLVQLRKLFDKKKLSPAEYQEEFLKTVSFSLQYIRKMFPNLDNNNIKNLGVKWFKTEVRIGNKYLKEKQAGEAKEKKYDFGIYR